MSTLSAQYHSIIFNEEVNTWDDWHLIPSSRPVVLPPKKKKKTLEIPGMDGVLDLSETLTKYPVFSNRQGSWEFIVDNGYKEWYQAYSDIMDYLHGQKMIVSLEDDREYFYEGTFEVNEWRSEKDYSRIVIDYDVGPYKWTFDTSVDEWKWDPFNFRTGVITTAMFKNIRVSTTARIIHYKKDFYGRAPLCPTFSVSTTGAGVNIRFVNPALGIDHTERLQNGSTRIPEFVFYGDTVDITFQCVSGSGTVSIDFRKGRL